MHSAAILLHLKINDVLNSQSQWLSLRSEQLV